MDQNRQFDSYESDQKETNHPWQQGPEDWGNSPRDGQQQGMKRYQVPYDPRPRDSYGRIIDRTNGMRALWMGVFALAFFATGLNVLVAMAAIAFGVIQLVRYSSKAGRWQAIMGIAMALASLTLLIGSYVRIAGNPNFLKMLMNQPGQNILFEQGQEASGVDVNVQAALKGTLSSAGGK